MLKDGLGKVLFIGPRHVTKWMGATTVHSPAAMGAMDNLGFRLATEDDIPLLADGDLKKLGRTRTAPVVLPPIEVAPVVVDLAEVADPIDEELPPPPKKRGRPRKTNTTEDHAD